RVCAHGDRPLLAGCCFSASCSPCLRWWAGPVYRRLCGEGENYHAGQHHEGAGGDLAHFLLLPEEQGPDGEREEDLDLLDGLDIGGQREQIRVTLGHRRERGE